jgi:histidinol dehydrogenase
MQRLDAEAADFTERFDALVNARREADADVADAVRAIIGRVRDKGDAALRELTQRFDRHDLNSDGLAGGRGRDGRGARRTAL